MKYVASCSFGKDSLAMVLKILEMNFPLDEVIYFDSGMDFDSIYCNRDKMKLLLEERGITYTELHSKNTFLYDMLERPVKYRKRDGYHYGYGWCGGSGIRWGTKLKILEIKKYYKKMYGNEDVYEYIGIAFDELHRVKSDSNKIYPLVDWKMTERDCLKYCYDKGWNWNEQTPRTECGYIDLYTILDRVSCWCCQNKNLKELKNIYLYLPEYWQRLRELQSKIDMPMKGKISIFDLEDRFEKEIRSMECKNCKYCNTASLYSGKWYCSNPTVSVFKTSNLETCFEERARYLGKSTAIFNNIESNDYTDEEKYQAIDDILYMPTHNGITKSAIIRAFKWVMFRRRKTEKTGFVENWILCSEKMPAERDSMFAKWKGTEKWVDAMFEKVSDEVIVTVKFETGAVITKEDHTVDGVWSCTNKGAIKREVIAWMPLPEPYSEV